MRPRNRLRIIRNGKLRAATPQCGKKRSEVAAAIIDDCKALGASYSKTPLVDGMD